MFDSNMCLLPVPLRRSLISNGSFGRRSTNCMQQCILSRTFVTNVSLIRCLSVSGDSNQLTIVPLVGAVVRLILKIFACYIVVSQLTLFLIFSEVGPIWPYARTNELRFDLLLRHFCSTFVDQGYFVWCVRFCELFVLMPIFCSTFLDFVCSTTSM